MSSRSQQPSPPSCLSFSSLIDLQTLLPSPPAAYALGFLDCKDISARCMLTIFQFFATKTDASVRVVSSASTPAHSYIHPCISIHTLGWFTLTGLCATLGHRAA